MATRHPWLIVGGGIAGTLIGWEFLRRSEPFVLIDPGKSETSSRVAAGVINPITGPRLQRTHGIPDQLHLAEQVYDSIGETLGDRYYHRTGMVRLCEEKQSAVYERKILSGELAPYGTPMDPPTFSSLKAFSLPHAGFLEVERFLADSHVHFASLDLFRETEVDLHAIEENESSVQWNEQEFAGVILCLGHEGAGQRWFDWLPFRSAKGEVLDLKLKEPPSEAILNRSANWLLPPRNGIARAGSTYAWAQLDCLPTDAARESILAGLDETLGGNTEVEVVGHRAAVRPVIHGRRPVVGSHPEKRNIAVLNGLGSKGVLHAPYCVVKLADHLLDGEDIPLEISTLRNF